MLKKNSERGMFGMRLGIESDDVEGRKCRRSGMNRHDWFKPRSRQLN